MFVSVCGLLGSGKSTLVHNLAEKDNCIEFQEPVESNPFLTLYYEDPTRWSYAMQVNLLFERYKMTQEAYLGSLRDNTVLLDSTIYSDMAFALVQKWSGYFTDKEYQSYLNMHKVIASQVAFPDITFWLELPIEETIRRIQKRSRDCEAGIPYEYLKDLREAYSIVLSMIEGHTKVIRLDATKSAEEVYLEASNTIKNIKALSNEILYN